MSSFIFAGTWHQSCSLPLCTSSSLYSCGLLPPFSLFPTLCCPDLSLTPSTFSSTSLTTNERGRERGEEERRGERREGEHRFKKRLKRRE
jgi:hypothetical protein